jgi:hypothetical protein
MNEKLLTWDDLAKLIAQMTPEKKAQPVLGQNSSTGAYFGYTGIRETEDDEWEHMPGKQPVLCDDHNWLWFENGTIKRSRYYPF